MKLSVENLHAGYGDRTVVRGVDFIVQPGQVSVIIGPNGCGKTTLLKAIGRLVKPTAGRVLLDEIDVWGARPSEVAQHLSLLPQQPIAPEGITVEDLVRYGRHPHQGLLRQWSQTDYEYLEQALDETQLQAIRHERLEHLSGGQRQRAWLAMCLAQDTPLVLLDEPTSALDLGHQVEVLKLVRALAASGKSFLLVLHDLFSAARFGDYLIAMQEGEVVAQGTAEDVVSAELVKKLYGVDVQILAAPGDQAPLIVPNV